MKLPVTQFFQPPITSCLSGTNIIIIIIIYLFIYLFKLQMIFTLWQWYYNKTQHTNNTNHTK
jgi:hypothetical protein